MVRLREARAGDAAAMARVFMEGWRAEHRGVLPEDVLAARSQEESERNWTRALQEVEPFPAGGRCIYVAEDGDGQVVGLAMAGPERTGDPAYTGEVYILGIDDAHRRQGIGRRLVERAAERLARDGYHTLLIRVLEANTPARQFYKALGGRLVGGRQIEEAGFALDEVAYGWDDIASVARAAPPP